MLDKERMDFPFEIKQGDVTQEGLFKGYASIFDRNPDSQNDIVSHGAFTETLEKGGRNGTGIAMLAFHDPKMPVGVYTTLEERKKGLYVEGQLALKTQLGAEMYELLKMGAIKGLSIGFNIIESVVDKTKKVRNITKANLWEISLVTFPAKRTALVTGVKDIEGITTERELEQYLREAGISRSSAKWIVGLAKASLRDAAEKSRQIETESGEWQAVLDQLSQSRNEIQT